MQYRTVVVKLTPKTTKILHVSEHDNISFAILDAEMLIDELSGKHKNAVGFVYDNNTNEVVYAEAPKNALSS